MNVEIMVEDRKRKISTKESKDFGGGKNKQVKILAVG